MYTGVYSGFSELDDGLLSLLCTFIGVKVAQIRSTFQCREKEERLAATINTVNTLYEQRTYMNLLIGLRELLPPLVGYEFVGVYFHDTNSNPRCIIVFP